MKKANIYREFSSGEDVVVTDLSTVRLSAKSLSRLNAIDANWRGVLYNKRLRSKVAMKKRVEVQTIIDEVGAKANEAWSSGGTLEVY